MAYKVKKRCPLCLKVVNEKGWCQNLNCILCDPALKNPPEDDSEEKESGED